MKNFKIACTVALAVIIFSACKTTQNQGIDYSDGVISSTELEMIEYPLADTILKYSMKGMTDMELTQEMDDLGNAIASNLGSRASVLQLGQGVVVSLDRGDVFEIAGYTLDSDLKETLSALAYNLKNNPDTYVVVYGRTDNIGSSDFNEKLAYKRAAVVANYLHSFEIDKDRLFVESFGEKQPDYFNFYSAGRDRNRRVDLLIIPSNEMRLDASTN